MSKIFEGIDFSGFDAVDTHQKQSDGGSSVELPLSEIIEDPDQPRRYFNEESLKELAGSIKERGILQPIIVREKNENGHYVIVMGARRYRAASLARFSHIPVIIRVKPSNNYDQMIENIQRENLFHADIANFIEGELKGGHKAVDIAKTLGKSRSWLSLYTSFSKMHEVIKERVEEIGIRAAYELQKAVKINADETLRFMASKDVISQREALSFVRDLKGETASLNDDGNDEDVSSSPHKRRSIGVVIFVRVDDRIGRLMTEQASEKGGQFGIVSFDNGSDIQEISLNEIELIEILNAE